MRDPWLVHPGSRPDLATIDSAGTPGLKGGQAAAAAALADDRRTLGHLQERLWAEAKRTVLVVLQGHGRLGVVKCFLHISAREQRRRFIERLEDPAKRWKFQVGDLDDRTLWDDYRVAYEDAMEHTSIVVAPWHVIPADHKWYRNWAISRLLITTLEELDPQYPARPDLDGVTVP